jgi:nucleoside-diphosphate-sugar epimerase
MVNAAGGDTWSDEDTAYRATDDSVASRAIAASLVMEQSVTRASLDWIILRGGLFYGPGTGMDDEWHARAAAGKLRLPGSGEDFASLVHISDMAHATVAAVERWPSRRVMIVCDDQPARWRDVFGFVAATTGQQALKTGGFAGFPSFRLRNARARELLDWAPAYENYRMGLAR